MEGPPLQTMERSRPVVNQRSRICLCFSTGRRFSNLGSGQIDSSCLSPSDTGFHGCRPQKRKGPPLPRLPPPAREMPPTSRQLTSETSAGVQPWLIQGIRSGDGVGDLFIYLFIKDIKNNRMRIAQQENSVEKRGWVAWFTRETNKTSRQEACTTYIGCRRPSVLPKERRHWGLPGRILEAQA